MAFQDQAVGICARLHLTAVRKPILIGIVVVLGVVVASAVLALASPAAAGEVVAVISAQERSVGGEDASGAEAATGEGETISAEREAEGGNEGDSRSGEASLGGAGSETMLCVHVDGEVAAPGVYYLPEGSRVVDAVEAAGGMTGDARSSGVNLAQGLTDGQQVLIPGPDDVPGAAGSPAGGEGAAAGDERVNVNTATAAELETLDGIGEVTAAKIIAEREARGPFASPEDLKRVSGIGDKKIEALRDRICL